MMARAGVNDFLLLIFGVRQDWQIAGMSTVGNHNDLSLTPCQLWSSAFLTHFVTKSYIFPFLVLASPSNWPFWGVSPRPLPTGYTITKARAQGGGMRIQVNWLRSAFSIHLVPVLFNQSHVKRTRWHVPSKASSSDHVELVQSVSGRPSIKPGSKDTIRQHRRLNICFCIGGIDKYCFSVSVLVNLTNILTNI